MSRAYLLQDPRRIAKFYESTLASVKRGIKEFEPHCRHWIHMAEKLPTNELSDNCLYAFNEIFEQGGTYYAVLASLEEAVSDELILGSLLMYVKRFNVDASRRDFDAQVTALNHNKKRIQHCLAHFSNSPSAKDIAEREDSGAVRWEMVNFFPNAL